MCLITETYKKGVWVCFSFGLEHSYMLLTLSVTLLTDTHVSMFLTAHSLCILYRFQVHFCAQMKLGVSLVDKITNLPVPIKY